MSSASPSQLQNNHDFSATAEALLWRERVVETLTRRSHPQNRWLWPSAFGDFAKKRGLNVGIGTNLLEKWDEMGVFHPLIRVCYPTTIHRKRSESHWDWESEPFEGQVTENNREDFVNVVHNGWNPEDVHRPEFTSRKKEHLQVATVENFVPWENYTAINDDQHRTSLGGVYYHPSQIFRLQNALETARISCDFTDLEVSSQVQNWFQQDIDHSRKILVANEVWHLKTLYLLGLIEDRYLPHWRGARYQIHVKGRVSDYDNEEDGNDWHSFSNHFDASVVLASCELSLDEIQEMRRDLAWRGECLDPNSSFYLLFRHFAHEQRQRFENDALLAWDYYEAAEMIGWFLRDATGEKQPQTDDLNTSNGWWKKDRYGVEADEIDFNSGNILRRLLHSYALDPFYKLLLVLEGESEAEFVRTWCVAEKWDLELMGIRLLVLEGIPGLNSKTTQQNIEQAKSDKAGVIVVVDDELDAGKKIDDWVAKGLLTRRFEIEELQSDASPRGGLVWSPCFEDVNFSLDQLIDAWFECSQEWILTSKQPDRVIEKDDLRNRVELIRRNPPQGKKCDSWIDAMVMASRGLRLPLDKPVLARKLAELYGKADVPIVRLLFHCRRIAELATNYGPPRPDGGFGYFNEDEENAPETA